MAVAAEPIQTGSVHPAARHLEVARVGRNDRTLAARIDGLAKQIGVEVRGVNTAFPRCPVRHRLGVVVSLKAPRIALVGETGISQTSYGHVWWSLEQRYGIKFTPISSAALQRRPLSRPSTSSSSRAGACRGTAPRSSAGSKRAAR